jgi:hypothetical protein
MLVQQIVLLASFYNSVMSSKNFSSTQKIKKARKTRQLILMKTTIDFFDSNGGSAYGEVDLAITPFIPLIHIS